MITSLNELRRQFLEAEIGMSIPSEIDIETAENKWLSILSGLDELTPKPDLFRALFQTQNAKRWDDYLIALGFSGSRETMLRDFYSSDLSFNAMLTSDLDLIFGEDKVWTFDGVDDYIDCGDYLDFLDGVLPFSIEEKFTLNNFVDYPQLLNHALDGSHRIGINVKTDGTVVAGFYNGSSYTFRVSSNNPINISTDYTLKVSYDGSVIKMYLNDVEQTGTLTPYVNSSGFYIGMRSNNGFLNGTVNYLKIYSDPNFTDLEAYYNLLDSSLGSDNVKDLSGNGNHGTSYGKGKFTRTTSGTVTDYAGNIVSCGIDVPRFEGARFINDDKGWSDKMPEKAIEFDSSSTEHVEIPYDTSLNPQNNFTISFAVKQTANQTQEVGLWDLYGSSYDEQSFRIYTRDSNEIRVAICDEDGNRAAENTSGDAGIVNLNEWYFFSITYSDRKFEVYRNGMYITSRNFTNPKNNLQLVEIPIHICNRQIDNNSFSGLMGNTIIHNIVLTGEQVMQQYLYNKKGSDYLVARENVVGAWKLDDTTSTIVDYSGNGNDGTFYSGGTESTPTLVDGVYDSDSSISDSLLKGILIEEQRTNICTYSEDFDSWTTKSNVTITSNTINAPDNSLTADLVVGDGTTSTYSYVGIDPSYASGSTATFSCYIKNYNATTSKVIIRTGVTAAQANITWSGDEITNIDSNATAELIKDGWYLIKLPYTSTETDQRIRIQPDHNDDTTVKGIYVWGAQLELGTFATSYIPTDSASVTRTADILSYDYNNNIDFTEGTCYAELTYEIPTGTNYFVSTGSLGRMLYTTAGATDKIKIYDGTLTAEISNSPDFQDNQLPIVSSWGATDGITVSKNGVDGVVSSFDGDMETGDINIGKDAQKINIKNVKIWKEQLKETKRKEMTK